MLEFDAVLFQHGLNDEIVGLQWQAFFRVVGLIGHVQQEAPQQLTHVAAGAEHQAVQRIAGKHLRPLRKAFAHHGTHDLQPVGARLAAGQRGWLADSHRGQHADRNALLDIGKIRQVRRHRVHDLQLGQAQGIDAAIEHLDDAIEHFVRGLGADASQAFE